MFPAAIPFRKHRAASNIEMKDELTEAMDHSLSKCQSLRGNIAEFVRSATR